MTCAVILGTLQKIAVASNCRWRRCSKLLNPVASNGSNEELMLTLSFLVTRITQVCAGFKAGRTRSSSSTVVLGSCEAATKTTHTQTHLCISTTAGHVFLNGTTNPVL